jgi:hypothetical protein
MSSLWTVMQGRNQLLLESNVMAHPDHVLVPEETMDKSIMRKSGRVHCQLLQKLLSLFIIKVASNHR